MNIARILHADARYKVAYQWAPPTGIFFSCCDRRLGWLVPPDGTYKHVLKEWFDLWKSRLKAGRP